MDIIMLKENISELDHRFKELLRKPNKSQAEIEEKERVRLELEAALQKDEQPLINDLQKFGINVSSAWDLVNTAKSYKKAIPVLIEHLSKPYHSKNKEGIVRALAVKEAVSSIACKAVVNEYHNIPKADHFLRWVFGNTMTVIITEECINNVIDIVLDETNGESRQMFVAALGKLGRKPRKP
jgi:hypothetical protein